MTLFDRSNGDIALSTARPRGRDDKLYVSPFQDRKTGLLNHAYLRDYMPGLQWRISSGLIAAAALYLIDLGNFKLINETHGTACGDRIIKTIADILLSEFRDAHAIARYSLEEFVVVFEREIEAPMLAAMADRVIDLLNEPIAYGERVIRLNACVGIVVRSSKDADVGSMLNEAAIALQEARKHTFSAFRFFNPHMLQAATERTALLDDVRDALAKGEFELHYQPQFSAQDGALIGFEALARWRHPRRGWVSPAVFIPIMEYHGLINALGEWVLRTASAEMRRWPDHIKVAINVSPSQLRGVGFSLALADTLLNGRFSPHRLELEITESVFIENEERTRAVLESWRILGVRVALDDFGCGYSSLSYLSVFPIDKIKIDRGFLSALDPSRPEAPAAIILRTIIGLGRSLGMSVTAEGVETSDQLDYVRRHGCTEMQGYLLGRPLPAHEAYELTKRFQQSARIAIC